MTALRSNSMSDVAANILTNSEVRGSIGAVLAAAGESTATTISSVSDRGPWRHRFDFRCEPAGRQISGLETAAVMDTHNELAGTLMVGCRRDAVQSISREFTSLESVQSLGARVEALESANIIGSGYLNGLRTGLDHVGFSSRAFLPSPPRFLRASVEEMLEIAIGGQALGDRGWIADHRVRSDLAEIIVVWIPTAEAIVALGTAERPETQ